MDNDLYEKDVKKYNGMSVVRQVAKAYEGVVVDDATDVENTSEGSVAILDQQNTEDDDHWLHMQKQLLEEEEELLSMLVHTETENDHLKQCYQPYERELEQQQLEEETVQPPCRCEIDMI